MDLSKGFDTFQQLDDTADDHLDGLLKTIIDLEQRTGTKCTAEVVTWRYVYSRTIFLLVGTIIWAAKPRTVF